MALELTAGGERADPIKREDGMRFRRLLVAFDGSARAKHALTHAVALAQYSRGRLTVLLVVPDDALWAISGFDAPVAVPRGYDTVMRDRQKILDRAVDVVPVDVPVVKLVRRGPVATTILAEARRGEHDAIVIGSSGRGSLRSWLAGSTVRRVTRASPVPVLVAGPSRLFASARITP
jgi:nucleotide-binding universal stress UspA family protein